MSRNFKPLKRNFRNKRLFKLAEEMREEKEDFFIVDKSDEVPFVRRIEMGTSIYLDNKHIYFPFLTSRTEFMLMCAYKDKRYYEEWMDKWIVMGVSEYYREYAPLVQQINSIPNSELNPEIKSLPKLKDAITISKDLGEQADINISMITEEMCNTDLEEQDEIILTTRCLGQIDMSKPDILFAQDAEGLIIRVIRILSNTQRYSGQLEHSWTVLEHSYAVYKYAKDNLCDGKPDKYTKNLLDYALLHEFFEGMIGVDIPTPIKYMQGMEAIRLLEDEWLLEMYLALIDPDAEFFEEIKKTVKKADKMVGLTEAVLWMTDKDDEATRYWLDGVDKDKRDFLLDMQHNYETGEAILYMEVPELDEIKSFYEQRFIITNK